MMTLVHNDVAVLSHEVLAGGVSLTGGLIIRRKQATATQGADRPAYLISSFAPVARRRRSLTSNIACNILIRNEGIRLGHRCDRGSLS
jgi:hypothetical protein